MTTVVKRDPLMSPFTELMEWFDNGWPTLFERRPMNRAPMRIEDYLEADKYVLRVEMPGIDPDKDVTITVDQGVLTVTAERSDSLKEKGHSEFHYGSFMRRVALPTGYKEDQVLATYTDGILELTRLERGTTPFDIRRLDAAGPARRQACTGVVDTASGRRRP